MRGTTNKKAWVTYLEAEKLFSINSRQKMAEARRKFAESITLDPNFARGHGYLSYVITRSVQLGWMPETSMKAAERHAREAVRLDPNDYTVFWDLGFCLFGQGKLKPALKEYAKALDLYENFTDMLDRKHGLLAEIAEAYVYDGRPHDAIKLLKRALRNPDWYKWNLGWAYYNARDYDAALAELESIESKPGDTEHVYDVQLMIAACYAQKGNDTMAKANIGMFRKHRGSNFKVNTADKRVAFKKKGDKDHWFDGLRKAGLRDR